MTVVEQRRGKMLNVVEHTCGPWTCLGMMQVGWRSKAIRTAWITYDVLFQKRKEEAMHFFFITALWRLSNFSQLLAKTVVRGPPGKHHSASQRWGWTTSTALRGSHLVPARQNISFSWSWNCPRDGYVTSSKQMTPLLAPWISWRILEHLIGAEQAISHWLWHLRSPVSLRIP